MRFKYTEDGIINFCKYINYDYISLKNIDKNKIKKS
jgi:hypothetical protein